MKLFLVRHGETASNIAGALDTATPGADLSATGRTQAADLVARFSDAKIEALFGSTLIRTQQTLEPLSEQLSLTPTLLNGLREISAGDYEMRTDEAAVSGYLGVVADWIGGETNVRMPGAETGTEFLARYDAAIDHIVSRGVDTALLVSHGAAIRTWIGHRADIGNWEGAALSSLPNVGVITLAGTPGAWTIQSWSKRDPNTANPAQVNNQ